MDAYIIDACRTPRGRRGGGLAGVHPIDLCTLPMKAIVARSGVDVNRIEDAMIGCVTETGEQGACIGRAAVLTAGWPVEILSRCPMGSDMGSLPPSLTERYNLVPQGLSAEMIAERWNLSRTELDEFALESQRRAWQAIREGRFGKSLVPVPDAPQQDGTRKTVAVDEHPRPQTTLDGLAALKPSFLPNGKIHAGNSSGIVDGASGVLLASKRAVKDLGLKPRARVVDTVVVGSEPVITMREVGIPHEKVNVNGGAIALGHPLGATGAMLIGTLLDELERTDRAVGLSTMCIGYGMGIATIIERV